MYNFKANGQGGRAAPIGLTVHFDGRSGPVEMHNVAFRHMDRALDKLRPPHIRLTEALQLGAQSVSSVASQLSVKAEAVERELAKYPTLFVKLGGSGGDQQWALRAMEA